MCATFIYADTTVWNTLCDQSVDGGGLTKDLAANQSQLVLGTNAVYEMARTFKGSRPHAHQRGKELFSYLRQYVQLDIPLLRQTDELLRDEVKHVRKEIKDIALWYGSANYKKLVEEVDKLSEGVFDSRAAQFIPLREAEAKKSRNDLYEAIEEQSHLKQKLSEISEESVGRWIAKEVKHSARRILKGHLVKQVNGLSLRELTWLAKRLLGSSHYRVSNAMVRSDIYLNWRYCRRGALGKDIPDDNYHAVNASYCNFFVTTDPGLAEYMSHVLRNTKVRLYGRKSPIRNWLVAICGQP